jgi:hypothetical protein
MSFKACNLRNDGEVERVMQSYVHTLMNLTFHCELLQIPLLHYSISRLLNSLKTSFITASEIPIVKAKPKSDKINFNGFNKSSFITRAKLLSIQFRATLFESGGIVKSIIFPRGAVFLSLVIFIILFRHVKHLNRYESKCYDRKHFNGGKGMMHKIPHETREKIRRELSPLNP